MTPELILRDEQFTAVWPRAGQPVGIYHDAGEWLDGELPTANLAVAEGTPFTSEAMLDILLKAGYGPS